MKLLLAMDLHLKLIDLPNSAPDLAHHLQDCPNLCIAWQLSKQPCISKLSCPQNLVQ